MGRYGKPNKIGGFTPLWFQGFCGLIKGWREAPGLLPPQNVNFYSKKKKKKKISLWVNNEEGLYKLARSCGDYETLVKVLYDEFGVTETRDGVKFADPKLNIVQLNSNIFDL